MTGGAGFLGSHLCERLLAHGDEVVALDNFVTGRPANLEHLLEHDRFRLVKTDVTEYVHVPGPVDRVLHFASPASPIDYLLLPIEAERRFDKLTVLTIAPLLARAIREVFEDGSVTSLFDGAS